MHAIQLLSYLYFNANQHDYVHAHFCDHDDYDHVHRVCDHVCDHVHDHANDRVYGVFIYCYAHAYNSNYVYGLLQVKFLHLFNVHAYNFIHVCVIFYLI